MMVAMCRGSQLYVVATAVVRNVRSVWSLVGAALRRRVNVSHPVAVLHSGESESVLYFFFSSRRRHTRFDCDWSSDVCSSDLPVARLRLLLVACATLGTAAAVSLAGIVGWVGLVVPHVARLLVGPNFVRLLPASALLGAGFVVAADTRAQQRRGIELPLGILTALVGAPFFLYLLSRTGRN